jgi:hypothetical protein
MADQTAPDERAANCWRTRITVPADHGRPVGVATLRSFRIRAVSGADLSANSAKMGLNRSARSLAAASLVRFGIGAQSLQKSPNCQPLYDEPRFFRDGRRCASWFGGPPGLIAHHPERPGRRTTTGEHCDPARRKRSCQRPRSDLSRRRAKKAPPAGKHERGGSCVSFLLQQRKAGPALNRQPRPFLCNSGQSRDGFTRRLSHHRPVRGLYR